MGICSRRTSHPGRETAQTRQVSLEACRARLLGVADRVSTYYAGRGLGSARGLGGVRRRCGQPRGKRFEKRGRTRPSDSPAEAVALQPLSRALSALPCRDAPGQRTCRRRRSREADIKAHDGRRRRYHDMGLFRATNLWRRHCSVFVGGRRLVLAPPARANTYSFPRLGSPADVDGERRGVWTARRTKSRSVAMTGKGTALFRLWEVPPVVVIRCPLPASERLAPEAAASQQVPVLGGFGHRRQPRVDHRAAVSCVPGTQEPPRTPL